MGDLIDWINKTQDKMYERVRQVAETSTSARVTEPTKSPTASDRAPTPHPCGNPTCIFGLRCRSTIDRHEGTIVFWCGATHRAAPGQQKADVEGRVVEGEIMDSF
jgi:hypothetical protein